MMTMHRIRALASLAAALLMLNAYGGTIYVNAAAAGVNDGSSWTDAFTDLRTVLSAAESGDELWVAAGTYRPAAPNGDRSASFTMKSNVSMYGGFQGDETELSQRDWLANETILSGDLNNDDQPDFVNYGDNSYHVVDVTAWLPLPYRIDGFTIRGGNAEPPESNGGGMLVSVHGGFIQNCRFTENSASARGGGIDGQIVSPRAQIRRCVFVRNRAQSGGAVSFSSGQCLFEDCVFEENSAVYSGAVYYGGSTHPDPEFVRCVFVHNHADDIAGALRTSGGPVEVLNCWFIGNTAGRGGAVNQGNSTFFRSCLFLANSAVSHGGAIQANAVDRFYAENCTIVGNHAGSGGGIWSSGTSSHTVLNSILWGNSSLHDEDVFSSQIILSPNTPPMEVSWNCIEGWAGQYAGEGNTGADPALADVIGLDGIPGSGDEDLRLQAGSPAIDAGSSPRVAPDSFDLDGDGDASEPWPFDVDGQPRLVDDPLTSDTGVGPAPVVDMGAFEFQPPRCYADFTGDGTLDLFDFLAYLNAFNAGNKKADCAPDGVLDLFDFLCFVNAFNEGC